MVDSLSCQVERADDNNHWNKSHKLVYNVKYVKGQWAHLSHRLLKIVSIKEEGERKS